MSLYLWSSQGIVMLSTINIYFTYNTYLLMTFWLLLHRKKQQQAALWPRQIVASLLSLCMTQRQNKWRRTWKSQTVSAVLILILIKFLLYVHIVYFSKYFSNISDGSVRRKYCDETWDIYNTSIFTVYLNFLFFFIYLATDKHIEPTLLQVRWRLDI